MDYKVSFQIRVRNLINLPFKYKRGLSQAMKFLRLKTSMLIMLIKVKIFELKFKINKTFSLESNWLIRNLISFLKIFRLL